MQNGGEIEGEKEEFLEPENGENLILSIDLTIQSIAEKYLKQACIDNVCTDGGNIVIMNPKTGDILAMTTYPEYDLNNPYEINSDELKTVWETMSQKDKTTSLQKMWRNKAIADSYEPGSVFKLITASAALEEGITTTDKEGEFCCVGYIEVAGVRIKCWRYYRPHGPESLRKALMNSCNPVFIGLGQKIGKEKYYEYLKKFGLLEKTGITLPGEANSIFLDEKKVGPVELATIAFGQRFKITPIQLVTAVSAIANKGRKVEPRLVKKSINPVTGEITEYPVKEVGRAISEKTANEVLDMMSSVVNEGTGKNARVKGYIVGGKTGTSEDGVNTGKYVASFMGVAPISDPQVVILVTLYNPTGEGGHQGGGIAAPVAGQVLTDVLEYLEANKDKKEEIEILEEVEVPELREKTIKEAKNLLKELGIELNINSDVQEINNDMIITEQMPKPGVKVIKGSKIEVRISE
ncbi:MAG: PASTA domain-containing protein [Clostridia bacterium]|nr:PASTA domain-containing protein [Clostridia bacterium]